MHPSGCHNMTGLRAEWWLVIRVGGQASVLETKS